jgi:hypothetical protein
MKLDERRAALPPIPAVAIRNPVPVGDLDEIELIAARRAQEVEEELRRQPEKPRWTSEIQTVR